MSKPTIFLNRISEQAELASEFKNAIEARFLSLVEVFQSSDGSSLPIGQNWFKNIGKAAYEKL